jgi:type IV pilus assembly protein PilP
MHAAGLIVFLALTGALADVPQAAPQPPHATPPAPQAEAAAPKPQENYTYDPAGRRDPFINLLGTGTGAEARQVAKKGDGPSGMTVAEISVRGVMQSRNGLIAMVQGPDNKTYIVHPGDKLLDGAIKSITPQGLVIEQAVNDPLSVVKQREVRKLLRGIEDAK